jgi:uncharacterized protein (DUF58 family)
MRMVIIYTNLRNGATNLMDHARTATSTHPVSPGDADLSQWQTTTRRAMSVQGTLPHGAAQAAYEHALAIARRLIDALPPSRAEDCVAALVVSHHNLADLYLDEGDIDAAARHLAEAHEALMALLLDAERDASLRQAALRHSRETHLALISHVARHGPHVLVTRALRTACMALNLDGPARH